MPNSNQINLTKAGGVLGTEIRLRLMLEVSVILQSFQKQTNKQTNLLVNLTQFNKN